MSIRILFLGTTLAVGGAERQLALLVPRLRERGFEPLVATLRHRGRYFEELRHGGTDTVFVDMRSRWDVRGAIRGYRLWRARPQVVISHSVDAQVVGQAVADRAGAAHITIEHGGAGIRRGSHRAVLTGLVALRVDRVVAVSGSQLDDLRRLRYRSSAITVIPNGIPVLEPLRSASVVRRELGLSEQDVVATLVAGMRIEKRPDVFVAAVQRAHEVNPAIRGLVVGGGRELGSIQKLTRRLGDGVQILGEREDVADLMSASDIVCLSSDVEGLPVAVLEAMSLEKPVVATDVGGLRDAVVPGLTGSLVPPREPHAFADALLELAADGPRLRKMGLEGGRRYRESFTVETMVDRYEELILETIASRQGARP